MEYLFGQLGSAVPAVPLPNFLCTPSFLAGGVVVRSRKGLESLTTTEKSVYYQHSSHTKSKTQHYTSYQEENKCYPSQNQHKAVEEHTLRQSWFF